MTLFWFLLLCINCCLFCESFRSLSFKTSRWNGGVQKILPVKSLFCAPEEIPPTTATAGPELDALYHNITSFQASWTGFCRNITLKTGYEMNDIVHKNLASTWTRNACEIEGSTLSSEAMRSMIEGQVPHGVPVRQYQDFMGQWDAIQKVYTAVKDKTPISKHFLDTLNNVLVGHVRTIPVTYPDGQNHSMACVTGDYRKYPRLLKYNESLRTTPDPGQISAAMNSLIEMCNNPPLGMHPIEVAVRAHSQFKYILPYEVGTERQALLLMAYLLLKEGYPPALVFPNEHKEYTDALELANTTMDMSIIIKFIVARVCYVQRIMLTLGMAFSKNLCEQLDREDEAKSCDEANNNNEMTQYCLSSFPLL